jgi:hypothetical protein
MMRATGSLMPTSVKRSASRFSKPKRLPTRRATFLRSRRSSIRGSRRIWALPWVAQLVGVRLPANIGPDEARVLITEARGFQRGTRESIYAAASYWLTGEKTMYFRERDAGDPYALEVVTLDSETPDPAAVLDALIAQKPAGLILRYRQVTGWDYEELTLTGDTYVVVATDFATYATLTANEPS